MLRPEEDPPARRTYALVIVCEVLVIAALWLIGHIYS
jgi:hypothetical protein